MNFEITSCPVCGSRLNKGVSDPVPMEETYQFEFDCPLCGGFGLPGHVHEYLSNPVMSNKTSLTYEKAKLKSALFYYLRIICNHPQMGSFVYFFNGDVQDDDKAEKRHISLERIYRLYPENLDNRMEMVLQLIHKDITKLGERCYSLNTDIINLNKALRYVMADDDLTARQVDEVWKYLDKRGYVEGQQTGFTFTPEGWDKVDKLRMDNKLNRRESNTAFIAMDFRNKDTHAELVEGREAIKEAIKQAGYEPIIIDEMEHNQYIPLKIIEQISSARFVVADLTMQNCGVYYEAGLAKGMGKEVIFTCHENDFDNMHFDTRQINTIKWNEKENFVEDLSHRIFETIKLNDNVIK